ncbi:MAG TPA: peptidase M23, partial [Cryomorphaceae bacterium]|nr:peptidase M23 [Cryomorphaceae bacterium]
KPVEEANIPAYNLTPEATRLAANFAANKSRLPWPVERGLVVAKFGPQQHPVAKSVIINNNGIDIATERGSKARAAFDGEVSRVIRTPGAALAVFIRHGNYFTVYNNLSEVYVKQGDMVKSKQEIGSVFFNELEGKTVLHFELWKELDVVDPLPWLAGK